MRILEFKFQHKLSYSEKCVINKDSQVHVFYSTTNSTGKTTLMRAILYSLGFNIPDTELVKFGNYEFNLKLSVKEKIFNIYRQGALMKVNDIEYDLPAEEFAVRALLFNTSNYDLLNNILGAIYFDQEKGWTLLNRGNIIGINRFKIENFLRGLNDDTSDESYKLDAEIKALDKKIAQYNLMLDVAEYQAEVNQNVNHDLSYNTFDEELENDLIPIRQQLKIVENELSLINDVIRNNKNFINFIEQKKIFVLSQDGSPIRVTRHNLFNYEMISDSNEARKSLLIAERNLLKNRIAKIEAMREKQLTLDTLPSVEAQLVQRLASMKSIGAIEVKAILDGLKKEREKLSNSLLQMTKHNNVWIDEVCKTISKYVLELNIPQKYKIDLFTHNLKSKTGAILHKLVFIYKLAYIKALSKKLGYPLPIFCDSPNGREVERSTVDQMLTILKRDFSEHQLIIASIYNYKNIFASANIITLNGKLFDQDNLFDYMKKNNKLEE